MGTNKLQLILAIVCMLLTAGNAQSQHSVEVERMSAEQEHFKAMLAFDKLPQRRVSTAAIIAVARSAWALSLPARAIKEFDRAIRDEGLTAEQKARLLLSRAVIEYQEGRYQVSTLFSERGTALLENPGPLRAQLWLVWAEALSKLGSPGLAEEKYQVALDESDPQQAAGIHFLLAKCLMKLGKLDQAKQHFESVPLEHEYTSQAMRGLAEIALEQNDYEGAQFWLERGREESPNDFLDSWVDYAILKSAAQCGDGEKVRAVQEAAQSRYAPSDIWLNLLNAAAESYRWEASKPRPIGKQEVAS